MTSYKTNIPHRLFATSSIAEISSSCPFMELGLCSISDEDALLHSSSSESSLLIGFLRVPKLLLWFFKLESPSLKEVLKHRALIEHRGL